MNTGMLWFDNDPKTRLAAKIERAVDYYRQKYGRDPDLCLLHPSMVEKGSSETFKITVRAYAPVLPGHFWIGIEDKR
jgi:mevalonate pyrophosphate decarboxylase